MKKLIVAFFTVILIASTMFIGCGDATSDPFDAPVQFTWTATGDDGTIGTAAQYDLRFSTDPAVLTGDWESAEIVSGLPAPQPSGTAESFSTTVLVETGIPYYFAIKAADEAGNWSPISNIKEVTFADVTAPAAIIDFDAQAE